jgi:hypothetical protein
MIVYSVLCNGTWNGSDDTVAETKPPLRNGQYRFEKVNHQNFGYFAKIECVE